MFWIVKEKGWYPMSSKLSLVFLFGREPIVHLLEEKNQKIKTSVDIRYVYSSGPPLAQAHCRNCDNGINHSVSQSLFRTGSSHSIITASKSDV